MTLTPVEQHARRTCNRRFAVLIFALTLFYAAVCTPLYLLFSSNILFEDSVLPLLWDVLMGACNYLFYWGSFAFLLFLGARYSLRQCKAFFAVYAGAVLFRYTANLLASFLVMGFPTWSTFASSDLPYLLFDVVMDLVLMSLAVLAFHLIVDQTPLNIAANGSLMQAEEDVDCPRLQLWCDAQKLYDKSNALHRTAVWMGLIPAGLKMITRIIYDISYGAPTDGVDLMWMIVYYVIDILCAVVGYLVILFLLNHLLSRFYDGEARA